MAFTVGAIAAKDGAGATIGGGLIAADIAGSGTGPWFLFHGMIDGVAGVNKAQVDSSNRLAVLASQTGTWNITTVSTVTSLTQLNGQAINLGSGTGGSGTQRVIVDSSQLSALGQTTASGSTPVVIASDQTWGYATGVAVPARAMYTGMNAITALPSAATAGNLTGMTSDKFGRPVVLPVTIRDLMGTQTTTLSASTSETTIITDGGAGIFADLVALIVSNTSASTNTRIDFRDATGGSVVFSLESIAGAPPVGIPFMGAPIPQTTAHNNWTAQCATSTTDIRVYAVYAKNK